MDAKKRRLIKWAIVLVVLIALGVWIASRWKVWFGNPPEEPYVAIQTPGRVMLTFGNEPDERFVSWQYDSVPTQGFVEIVKNGAADTLRKAATAEPFKSRAGKSVFYRVLLDSLERGASYSYRVVNDSLKTGWYSFGVQADSLRNDYSFVFFGDIQDEVGGEAGGIFRSVRAKNSDAAFWLFGGDLIERPMDKFWGEAFSSLDSISQTLPIMAVTGNHEYLKGVERQLEGRFPLVFPYFLNSSYEGNAVYSFAYGEARFFFLDSNRDVWNLVNQREWLENELKSATEKWKIVVLHHPLYSIKGSMNNLTQRYMFNDLVQEYGVDLVLQGHEHGYARMSGKNEETDLKTPVYLISYCSEKQYRLYFKTEVDKYGTNDRFYQRISVSDKSVSVKTFTSNHELYDDFAIEDSCGVHLFRDFGKDIPQKIEVPDWFRKVKKEKRVKEYQKDIDEYLGRNSNLKS